MNDDSRPRPRMAPQCKIEDVSQLMKQYSLSPDADSKLAPLSASLQYDPHISPILMPSLPILTTSKFNFKNGSTSSEKTLVEFHESSVRDSQINETKLLFPVTLIGISEILSHLNNTLEVLHKSIYFSQKLLTDFNHILKIANPLNKLLQFDLERKMKVNTLRKYLAKYDDINIKEFLRVSLDLCQMLDEFIKLKSPWIDIDSEPTSDTTIMETPSEPDTPEQKNKDSFTLKVLKPDSPARKNRKQRPKKRRNLAVKELQCQHCNVTETPEWRKGPSLDGVICNACGLFYKKLRNKFGQKDALAIMATRKQARQSLNRIIPSTNEEIVLKFK